MTFAKIRKNNLESVKLPDGSCVEKVSRRWEAKSVSVSRLRSRTAAKSLISLSSFKKIEERTLEANDLLRKMKDASKYASEIIESP